MTVRLVLVTHAETAATRAARFPGVESLTEHGRSAAVSARGALRRIGHAWHGPEARCQETAAALGLIATAEPALADLDTGTWRGLTLAEVEAERPDGLLAWLTDPDATPHDGESIFLLVQRVGTWLGGLPARPARIAAVTHPAVARAAVLHVLGAPPSAFWSLDTRPLSQTWMSRHGGRWRLSETGHPLETTIAD